MPKVIDFSKFQDCMIEINCEKHKFLYMGDKPNLAFPISLYLDHPCPRTMVSCYIGYDDFLPSKRKSYLKFQKKKIVVIVDEMCIEIRRLEGKEEENRVKTEGIKKLYILVKSKVATKCLTSCNFFSNPTCNF